MGQYTAHTLHIGNSEVLDYHSVKQGLSELKGNAPSGKQNLEARVNNPLLFEIPLDSKDIRLYGGTNEDGRYRFKEDFSFNISLITGCQVREREMMGFLSIDSTTYTNSQGTEFVIIDKEEIEGSVNSYAISSQGYCKIRDALNSARNSGRKFNADELKKADGFKVDTYLTVDEHVKLIRGRNILEIKKQEIEQLSLDDFQYIHMGWLEHFTGHNNATPLQYLDGAKLYIKYVQEAFKYNCFKDEKGMDFFADIFLETRVKDLKIGLWSIQDQLSGSKAYCRDIDDRGCFLKIT